MTAAERVVEALREQVRDELRRLESSDRMPPIGGWRNEAVHNVALRAALNPYTLDGALRKDSMPPPDPALADALRAARARYAAAPSHAAPQYSPAPGTVCLVSAGFGDAYLAALRAEAGQYSLAGYNAEHSTEQVLALFDRAIKTAEGV